MTELLIISFDLIRDGENPKSLAIASLLSYLKTDIRYGESFCVHHQSVNMLTSPNSLKVEELYSTLSMFNFAEIDFIALSAYVWNEYLIHSLIKYIREIFEFNGDFILGGYQISYSSNPKLEYKGGNYFISGYGEKALLDIITQTNCENTHINSPVDFNELPSPYLTGEIVVSERQKMIRFETKRGCPYRCSFCAHRDLTNNKVHKHELAKIYEEISLFKQMQVGKLNIIDPIFNVGKEYLAIMEAMIGLNLNSLVSVQARFETIRGQGGKAFLDSCEKLNFHLEFGLQTAIQSESELINRRNNPKEIQRVMGELNSRGISYEISLIYGLPNQTLDSFKKSVDFVLDNGCENITAYPLMLLKGTELYDQKERFSFKEKEVGDFNIPVVIECDSFSEKDWHLMKNMAESLNENHRV